MNIALLALHVLVGLLFAAHGAQKLFGSFDGPGLEGTSGFFDTLGLRPGWLHARAAASAEFFGGILIALGLVTPFAAAALIGVMVAAITTVHFKNGFFATNQGYEFNLVLIGALFVLAAGDAGIYGLDHWFGWSMNGTAWGLGALGAGVIGGFGAVLFGRLVGRDRRRHVRGGPAHPTTA